MSFICSLNTTHTAVTYKMKSGFVLRDINFSGSRGQTFLPRHTEFTIVQCRRVCKYKGRTRSVAVFELHP